MLHGSLLKCGIQKVDVINLHIEVRSRTVLGLMEVTIAYYLVIRCVISIGIDICLVAVQSLALYSKFGSIEYMHIASLDVSLCCIYSFLCALCYSCAKLAEFNLSLIHIS